MRPPKRIVYVVVSTKTANANTSHSASCRTELLFSVSVNGGAVRSCSGALGYGRPLERHEATFNPNIAPPQAAMRREISSRFGHCRSRFLLTGASSRRFVSLSFYVGVYYFAAQSYRVVITPLMADVIGNLGVYLGTPRLLEKDRGVLSRYRVQKAFSLFRNNSL